jgi:hypothetical protein
VTAYLKGLMWLALIESFIPWLLIAHYVFGFESIWVFKIVSLSELLLIGIFHFTRNIIISRLSKVFLLLCVIGLPVGIFSSIITDSAFNFQSVYSYYYSCVMPILAMSFGMYLQRNILWTDFLLIRKFFVYAFFSTCGVIFVYFILYKAGVVAYWGLGTNMHYYLPFILTTESYLLGALGVAVVFFSGKRATSITVLLQACYFLVMKISERAHGKTMLLLIWVCLGGAFLGYLASAGMLDRLDATVNVSFDDDYSVLVAFGGRWEEVLSILEYFSKNPLGWLVGGGAGGAYSWVVGFDDYVETKSYAHFTPIGYLFKFGLPISLFIYGYFCYLIYLNWRNVRNPFFLGFFACVCASMFGANLLTDILPWLFCGYVTQMSPKTSVV